MLAVRDRVVPKDFPWLALAHLGETGDVTGDLEDGPLVLLLPCSCRAAPTVFQSGRGED